jgi:hypothetical protein
MPVLEEVQKDNTVIDLGVAGSTGSSEASEKDEPEFGVSEGGQEDGKEEEKGKEGTAPTDSSGKEKEVEVKKEDALSPDDSELIELRQIARDQKRQLDTLSRANEEINKKLQEANIIAPEDIEKQKEAQSLLVRRNEQLEDILEIMRVNPKFEDVDQVVSQTHFDDMVEAMAKVVVDKQGGKLDEVIKGIEGEIWSMRNPYKFMYEQIKKFHPKFKQVEAPPKKEEKKEDLTAVKIASSLQDIPAGGSSGSSSGWTAAKIDAMSEEELDKVPADVYQKYLKNQLK